MYVYKRLIGSINSKSELCACKGSKKCLTKYFIRGLYMLIVLNKFYRVFLFSGTQPDKKQG